MPQRALPTANRPFAGDFEWYIFFFLGLFLKSLLNRFEKLDITPRSALKIRPVLENWLREAEEKHRQCQQSLSAGGMDYVHISTIGKIRKRRTFFSPEALSVLNIHFDQSSHPTGILTDVLGISSTCKTFYVFHRS